MNYLEALDAEITKAEEAEKEAEALKQNPIVSAIEYGPEGLRWDERGKVFICQVTGNRFRLEREAD